MPAPDTLITFLPVNDLNVTHEFYHGVLELPLVLDQGACRIYRVSAGGCVGFCRRDDVTVADGVIVTLVTAEVDRWYRRLVALGVETDGPPRDNPDYKIYHFYTRDPDGWAVEVQRFHEPDWSATSSSSRNER